MVNIFSLRGIDLFQKKIITSKFNTIKHGGFDKCSSFSKRLVFKKYSLSFPLGKKIKKVSPCMENANNRPKCLVFSKWKKRSTKTPTLGQVSKENDRHGSEGAISQASH